MRDRRALDRAMARLASGDRAAFDEVFRAIAPPAHALARRLLGGDRAASEDAVQEAVIKVFARAHHYDPSRDALTWALALVAWECRTLRRRRTRSRDDGPLTEDARDPARSPEAAVMEAELHRLLDELLEAAPAADRATIVAAWRGEAPPSPATAAMRKRLERALERLRGAWRTRHGT